MHSSFDPKTTFWLRNISLWRDIITATNAWDIPEESVPWYIFYSTFICSSLIYYLVRYYFLRKPDWITRWLEFISLLCNQTRENFRKYKLNKNNGGFSRIRRHR